MMVCGWTVHGMYYGDAFFLGVSRSLGWLHPDQQTPVPIPLTRCLRRQPLKIAMRLDADTCSKIQRLASSLSSLWLYDRCIAVWAEGQETAWFDIVDFGGTRAE
jgi:hypothetical protein